MNSKLTLALVLLAGVAGVWLWKGDDWAPKIGIRSSHPEPAKSDAIATLEGVTPTAITRVEVAYPSGDPLVLEPPVPPGSSPATGRRESPTSTNSSAHSVRSGPGSTPSRWPKARISPLTASRRKTSRSW